VWDAAPGQEIRALRGHAAPIYGVALMPDGRRVVSGSGDHTVKVWDVAADKEILTPDVNRNGIDCLALSRDGKRIVSGSADKTVKVWDTVAGQEPRILRGHAEVVL